MRILILSLVTACYLSAARGQTTQPILTLNTNMHTSTIWRISSDAQGRYLLTCSSDKTAKLWDAASGELLRTFRPPIDFGNEGMLFACALSPDGGIVTVGGWTGYDWNKKHSIYLFNTQTGEMIHRILEFASVIDDLEFSPDGRYLAAAMADANGVKVFSASTWALVKHLEGYKDRTHNIAFDPSGRMATVCYDGNIRLYSSTFGLLKEKACTAGKKPFSIAFSPDGRKMAVGYKDSPTIQVVDANDLSLLYEPDISDANTVDNRVNKVCFSTDGQYLFAGGGYTKKIDETWWRMIRRWDNAGRGSYSDIPAGGNAIMDIKPMQDNSIIYCGAQPDFGRIKNTTKQIYVSAETNAYNSNDKSHLKLNTDATLVGFKPLSRQPLVFSLNDYELAERPCTEPSYQDQVNGLIISDWKSTSNPKLNGTSITCLKTYEICFCTDIAANSRRIVLGTGWNIYCLDDAGTEKWKTPAQSNVWAINIAGNEKVAVAALGDGTIRWYRMSDGKNILTLFAHPDNKRWILWTPSGYYNCSPGAEELIGWHVNNGPDKAASYYPVSKFRSIYYRPDVVDKMIETLDEEEALRLANLENNRKSQVVQITQMLPPTISILSPANGTSVSASSLSVRYQVTSPGDKPVLGVRALIDGRPVEDARGFKPAGTEGTLQINIPSRDCKVSLIAENQHGYSDPAVITLYWKGTTPTDILKPKLYLLAVGISNYDNPELQLKFAAKDARDMAACLQGQKGYLYGDVMVRLITDKEATRDNILEGLDWLQRETTSRDVAMIYLGGHGLNDNLNTFYFMPVGADPNKIRTTCMMFSEIKYTVAAIAGKVVLFADACHSGNIMGGRKAPDINGLVNELTSAENGAVVFTSSTGKQFSLENSEWGNGAFTKALVEGLNGKADLLSKGSITIKTLDAYIANRVKELTKGQQSPTTIIPNDVPDFPIAVVK